MIGRKTNFPDTYKHYSTKDLLDIYKIGANRLLEVIDGLSQDELLIKARGETKWSIYEIVVHVVDSELIGNIRFKDTILQMRYDNLNQPPTYFMYNQDKWARGLNYQTYDKDYLENSLTLFRAIRTNSYAHLEQVSNETWNFTGLHAELGEVTLRQLLELYTDHVERHISQIIEIRTLINRPIDYSLLLPVRLY